MSRGSETATTERTSGRPSTPAPLPGGQGRGRRNSCPFSRRFWRPQRESKRRAARWVLFHETSGNMGREACEHGRDAVVPSKDVVPVRAPSTGVDIVRGNRWQRPPTARVSTRRGRHSRHRANRRVASASPSATQARAPSPGPRPRARRRRGRASSCRRSPGGACSPHQDDHLGRPDRDIRWELDRAVRPDLDLERDGRQPRHRSAAYHPDAPSPSPPGLTNKVRPSRMMVCHPA